MFQEGSPADRTEESNPNPRKGRRAVTLSARINKSKAGSIYLSCSIAGLRHPLLKIMSFSSTMTCERRCPCEQRPGIGSAMTLAIAFRSASKSQPIFVRTVQSGQPLVTAGYDVHQTGPIRSPGSAPTNHQGSLYRLRVKPNRTFSPLLSIQSLANRRNRSNFLGGEGLLRSPRRSHPRSRGLQTPSLLPHSCRKLTAEAQCLPPGQVHVQ